MVLIDALDELPDDATRTSLLQKTIEFNKAYPNCTVLVTSRDYAFVSSLKDLAPFARFSISPFSIQQAGLLLEKVQRSRQLPVSASREIMRRLQEVHGFELNPLLVAIFAATSDYSRRDIPANITEFFKSTRR